MKRFVAKRLQLHIASPNIRRAAYENIILRLRDMRLRMMSRRLASVMSFALENNNMKMIKT